MGVLDNVKDSITGSSGNDSSDSSFDSGKFDDSFSSQENTGGGLDNDPGAGQGRSSASQQEDPLQQGSNSSPGQGNRQSPGQPSQHQGGRGQENPVNSPATGKQQNSRQGNPPSGRQQSRGNNSGQSPQSSPNAQAGRPQEGGTEPQLSSQTRKKMNNAGLDAGGQQPQRGNSTESVADRKNDLEEIKSQNEQIIELLKRINQSLQGGSTGRGTGRRQR